MFDNKMFRDGITPVYNKNTRGHEAGKARGFLEVFYFCQHADEDHGQKVDRTGEKEDHNIKHALQDVMQRNSISQGQQKGRAEIDAHEKTHDSGITALELRGK